MDDKITEVKPIESMENDLNQLQDFFFDLALLEEEIGEEYWSDFNRLRDGTDKLRAEYNSLYSKILTDHHDLKKLLK